MYIIKSSNAWYDGQRIESLAAAKRRADEIAAKYTGVVDVYYEAAGRNEPVYAAGHGFRFQGENGPTKLGRELGW